MLFSKLKSLKVVLWTIIARKQPENRQSNLVRQKPLKRLSYTVMQINFNIMNVIKTDLGDYCNQKKD
jgi:hypothetical protein